MTLLSLILALALEQLRPLGDRNPVWLLFRRYANSIERNFNVGSVRHGVIAWLLAVVPLVLIALLVHYLLQASSPILGLLWDVFVLYLTMGFRQFSRAFSDISLALAERRAVDAQTILREWTGKPTAGLSVNEMSRFAIEEGVVHSYRHVFGTMFWFIVLPGPAGALLFRLSTILSQKWALRLVEDEHFGEFAERVVAWLDWVPVRLTAASFAVMGDLENAIYGWRSQARVGGHHAVGILLASAAGAIGVRLGDPSKQNYTMSPLRQELDIGEEADPDALRSAVGLVWRSVLLWLSMILLVGVVSHVN